MDFSIDEEFDYEEDEFMCDSLRNDTEPKNGVENEKSNNTNLLSCEEDFLQINCTEEDENLVLYEQPSEKGDSKNTSAESKNFEKDEDVRRTKRKNHTRKKESNRRNRQNHKTNGSGYASRKYRKKKSFFRRSSIKKNVKKSPNLCPWLPACKFFDSNDMTKLTGTNPQLLNSLGNDILTQKVNLNDFQQEKYLQNSLLNLKVPIGNEFNTQNLPQQRSIRPLDTQSQTAFNENISKLNVNQSGVAQNGDAILRPSQDFSEIFRLNEAQNCYENSSKSFGPYVQNGNDVYYYHDFIGKREAPSTNLLLNDQNERVLTLHTLKYEEKELLKLKKEARLQRFMSDEIIRKETKPFEKKVRITDEQPFNSGHLGLEYKIQKSEPQSPNSKLLTHEDHQTTDQHFNCVNTSLPEIPNLSKEFLLKKQNPFEPNSKIQLKCSAGTYVDGDVVRNENSNVGNAEYSLTEDRKNEETKLFSVKKEANSHVKFVRTVSKSLDELGFRKPKTEVVSETSAQSSFRGKAFLLVDLETGYKQMTSQLTGCIVKVLNVPPSITVDDVLTLCSRVGAVKEIKLNFPKENSVVIRFDDPSEAENFFNLYHGREMNNCFLNVIVI